MIEKEEQNNHLLHGKTKEEYRREGDASGVQRAAG